VTKDLKIVWEKPVIVFYRERKEAPEKKSFAVVKANRLIISRVDAGTNLLGHIEEFFPLMGDIDYISSTEGAVEKYVLCWFDDKEEDLSKALRKQTAVMFSNGVTFRSKDDKRTYNADFIVMTSKSEAIPKVKSKSPSLVLVIYDTQTGFTEKMAEFIAEGAKRVSDVEVELLKIGTPFSVSKLNSASAIILGSPVVYGNVTPMMKTFIRTLKSHKTFHKLNFSDKVGAAFGSFAFSGGWVLIELSEEMEALGIRIVTPPVSVVDGVARQQPLRLEKQTIQSCLALGRTVAEKVRG